MTATDEPCHADGIHPDAGGTDAVSDDDDNQQQQHGMQQQQQQQGMQQGMEELESPPLVVPSSSDPPNTEIPPTLLQTFDSDGHAALPIASEQLPFQDAEHYDDDKFSDVFQGELVDVTTKFVERFTIPPSSVAKINVKSNSIVEKKEGEDGQRLQKVPSIEQILRVGEDNNGEVDEIAVENNQIGTTNTTDETSRISINEKEQIVGQVDAEQDDDDDELSLDGGKDESLAHNPDPPSLNNSVNGPFSTEGIIQSSPSSEKRRERRKFRQASPSPQRVRQSNTNIDATAVGGVESYSTTTTTTPTTTTTTTIHNKDSPITVSNERFEISSVGTCVKIRERRKKSVRQEMLDRQRRHHHHHSSSESKSSNSTTLIVRQDAEVGAGAGAGGVSDNSNKSSCPSPSNTNEILSRKTTTSPELHISMMKRRQKIVERVGKNKVPIAKKAWLQTTKAVDAMTASSPSSSDVDTLSPSVAASLEEDGGDSCELSTKNTADSTTGNCSPPKTPTITSKKASTDNLIPSPMTPVNDGIGSSSPCSQQLIVTPTNEVEMKLVDAADEKEATKHIMAPTLFESPSSLERHKARSERRQLRNNNSSGVVLGAKLVGDKTTAENIIKEIIPLSNRGSPSSLEKHKARSQRRQLRKGGHGTTNEEHTVLDKTTPQMSDDADEGCAVDVDEARALFPEEESLKIPSSQQCLDSIPLDSDAAWDVNGASEMNSILEKSKVENMEKIDDAKPLLHLDTISSSDNDGTRSFERASAKLLSQQDRMRIYNSGGFGEGDDSSVDNEDQDEDQEEQDLNSKYDSDDVADGDTFVVEVFEYEEMKNILNDDDESDRIDADYLSSLQLGPPINGINKHDALTFAPSSNRAQRWNQNPDAMSEAETEFDFFDTNASGVLSMKFVGQAVTGKPVRLTPPPPQSSSSSFELDQDVTPKIGPKGSTAPNIRKEHTSVELLKIPPPPPAKLHAWEQSKSGGLQLKPLVGQDNSPDKNLAPIGNGSDISPKTPEVETAWVESHSPHEKSNLNYKIQYPKSPKKKPHSITEELDLAGHTRMAEKIVIASSKAARKFEEQYSHLAKSGEEGLDPFSAKGDNYYYAGDASSIPPPHTGSPGTPAVGELVGGAFSPWKIPDRGEDESSIASLAKMLQENESYARATAAAVKTILQRRASEGKQDESFNESFEVSLGDEEAGGSLTSVLRWLFREVLPPNSPIVAAFSAFDINTSTTVQSARVLAIANDDTSFNLICKHVATSVTMQYKRKKDDLDTETEAECRLPADGSSKVISTSESPTYISFEIPPSEGDDITRPSSEVLAASFVDFVQEISNLTGITSPFSDDCSLGTDTSPSKKPGFLQRDKKTMQELVFRNEDRIVAIFRFLRKACVISTCEDVGHVLSAIDEDKIVCNESVDNTPTPKRASELATSSPSWMSSENRVKGHSTVRRSNRRKTSQQLSSTPITVNPLLLVPKESPSPFETAVWNQPSIVLSILSFLGNPVAVCAMKRLNVFCSRVVRENQHVLMRDAVRLGGMSKFVRPSFWLWVTEMCKPEDPIPLIQSRRGSETMCAASERNFLKLKDAGAHGKWHHVIERDVTRAFGNMPPHKTGARYRQDSIVRALVSFGREEIIRNSRSYQAMDRLPEGSEAKHFKLSSRLDCRDDSSHHSSGSITPTDTVSDWGGISPVGSFISEDPSNNVNNEESIRVVSYESEEISEANMKPVKLNLSQHTSKSEVSDPVLSGNALTSEMKVDLQNKLRSILHALAARHEAVGYCQGMDYIVAHLLRVLQDTILLRVIQRSMPSNQNHDDDENTPRAKDWRTISSDELRARMSELNSHSVVVEEIVFGVMDTFFSTYNLQHMYWPELRCLKTCCRVFEILIKQKLPVLADHFQHYDLNVGLFALGWFQTLFLYLPSMPSATVCHIWDIWLVERSFKIFFRVGTAILFLSQPTLLNNDLEGMMTYLNTFPDATLLRRDILIPCALQIKITNRMLVEIEMEVAKSNQSAGNNEYFPV